MKLRSRRKMLASTSSFTLAAVAATFEHLQHPVGHEEATDDVDRAEHDRHGPGDLRERVRSFRTDHQQPAEQHDSVNRVGARHQRRVQHRRHLRDHLEADEHGEHEDRDLVDERHTAAPIASLTRSLTTSPSCVMQHPATISSSKSGSTRPSADMWSSRFATLLEYSRLAWNGIWLGRLSVPSTITSLRTT